MDDRYLRIQQQIQRSFSVLKKCLHTWKESQQTMISATEKISNFTDQFQCCSKVGTDDLEIGRQFPDLKEKLLFKIECEVDRIFMELRTEINTMKECCDKLTRQYDNCIKTYNKLSSAEDLSMICERTATCPSVADMLEWLLASETLFRQQYLCKQQLMKMFRMNNDVSTELFLKEWEIGDKEMINEVEGYLCYTSFFLEEKI